ncbi:5-formyltetrahydrofolate cyclo-ligase [Leucobacter soli]|uniref:5-formyltetrahydrofolate cyclo-ligase n=1 Tax=Leucobacter soli TaxID=2812850 RepID=A0A916K2B2_9MICO|nr:5-formyltetrahydrofolate cyclo-ligase [Leucobacter soli]CAG7616881.1 5-formyltetrahydrofolate cyclo-ligase [Leucobacter soli]
MPENSAVSRIDAQKRRVRDAVRSARAALTETQRAASTDGLTSQLVTLASARGARSVSCYLPVGAEPDTRPFLAWARDEGVEVLLPAARPDGLMDWIVDRGAGTVVGAYGIPEPNGERLSPLAVGNVDLMLIPASAVDRNGIRVGWGRGYFDRCLGPMTERPPVFAVIYESELHDALPHEPHDIPVTGVVTPERILYLDR